MKEQPHPVDLHVGNRLRLRRTMLGLSQEKLGNALGLTFQQIQKYERGANRISASKLHEVAKILDVPISFFFEHLHVAEAGRGMAETGEPFEADQLQRRESVELIHAYYRITDPRVRRRMFELIKAVSTSEAAVQAAE